IVVLDELYISPKFRHKGYAHMFLKWMQEEFANKGVFINLEVNNTNIEAKQLYSSMGFEHDAFTRDGFEVLVKTLAPIAEEKKA
ncbi:MAG: GNAT family N-acetyltransferase, partial [Clostridia bacterium]